MNSRAFLALVLGACFAVAGAPARAADADETRLVAELVWGTNGEKPPGQDLKPISANLEKRLRRIFKWKNYFEIQSKEFVTTPAKPAKIEMSKECRLEVTQTRADEFEILLFGKGVLVVKKTQRLLAGETVVLGGDDKNDDAWFVVLTYAKPPPGKK
jgi:hypothetical protein